ncbi:hypothetical protein ACIBQ1_33390 [Nonomuraea sp. NPDC050153]|uniref:hypothetical protein n=1 Tax=Nonomuraea sp. NPDC050153 TaxID=3364359 RepID=UPI0037B56FD3
MSGVVAHRCLAPTVDGGGARPWRCSGCGQLWEPLPPPPVRRPERDADTPNRRSGIAAGASMGALCLASIAASKLLAVALCAAAVLGLVWSYRWERSG